MLGGFYFQKPSNFILIFCALFSLFYLLTAYSGFGSASGGGFLPLRGFFGDVTKEDDLNFANINTRSKSSRVRPVEPHVVAQVAANRAHFASSDMGPCGRGRKRSLFDPYIGILDYMPCRRVRRFVAYV